MKKTGIALLVLVCSVVLFFVIQKTVQKEVSASDFLPDNTLFYCEQVEFSKIYEQFLESPLGKTLTNLNYKKIVTDLGDEGQALLELDNLQKKIVAFLDDPALNELLGRKFSVALFPAKSFPEEDPAKALEERLLLIAKPRHPVQLLKFLAPVVSRDIEQSTALYGAHVITRYKLDDKNTISTATVEGLILLALEERLVRKGLDHFDTKENVLSENEDFKRLRKTHKGAQLFTYISIPSIVEQGRMISENLQNPEKKAFLGLLGQWNGWGNLAYGAWQEEERFKDRAEILFDKNTLDSRVARLCDVQPAPNKTLGMVPADTIFYYWTNTLNLPLLWELYAANLIRKQPGALDLLRKELHDSAGVELEEMLAMIDKEFAIITRDVEKNGIPLPKAAILIKLSAPDDFMNVFTKLLETAEIPLSRKQFKGRTLTYWGLAPQGGLQPAFCLIDEYLLISNSIDLVTQMISLNDDSEKNLLNSDSMEEVGDGLLRNNNSAAYVHVVLLANALKNMASWASSMAVLQGPETARKADVLVTQLLVPLLDGLSMYEKLASRSVMTKDSIILESVVVIGR